MKIKVLSLLGIILMVPQQSFSQDHSDYHDNIEVITITATQNPKESINDTNVSVTIFTADSIKERAVQSIADFFNTTPGVDASTTGQGSVQPIIRGLSQEQVLILVDGIRLSDERPGGNHILSIDPAQIEKVEIVKGPAAVLYGAGAIGGVVNFITKKGSSSKKGLTAEGNLSYQTATEGLKKDLHLAYTQTHYELYAGMAHQDSGNQEAPNEEIKYSFLDSLSYWGGLAFDYNNLIVDAQYWETKADIGIPTERTYLSDYFKDEKHSMYKVKLQYDFNQWIESASLSFSKQIHNRNRIREPKANSLVHLQVDKDTSTIRTQFILNPTDFLRVTTGADYYLEELTSSRYMQNLTPAATYTGVSPMAPSQRSGIGAFLQNQYQATSSTDFNLGLRYDQIKAETDGLPSPYPVNSYQEDEDKAFSGNFGGTIYFAPQKNIFFNIGKAFRAPTIIERYYYGPHDGPGADYGSSNLSPEKSWSFDLGTRFWSDHYQMAISTFYIQVDDMIRKVLTNPSAVASQQINQYQNIDEAYVYGLEWESHYHLTEETKAFIHFSYVRGQNKTLNQPLTDIPPFKVKYGLNYDGELMGKHAWGQLAITSAAKQTKSGQGEKKTPGYTTVDIRAGLSFYKNIDFNLAIENLFDKEYYNHLSDAWQSLDYYSIGMNAKAQLTFNF